MSKIKSIESYDWTISSSPEDEKLIKYFFLSKDNKVFMISKYYKDENRILITVSTSMGCFGKCVYCPYQKYYGRHLNANEMVEQVESILQIHDIRAEAAAHSNFQIIFGEMGDPLLNWTPVETTIQLLHEHFPLAKFYINTIAPNRSRPYQKLIKLGHDIPQVNIVYSINASTDIDRNAFTPFKGKLYLQQIRDMGTLWHQATNRHAFLNYLILPNENHSIVNIDQLKNLFSPITFDLIISNLYEATEEEKQITKNFTEQFKPDGYTIQTIQPIEVSSTFNDYINKQIKQYFKEEINNE